MQMKIDAYESYILALSGLVQHRDQHKCFVCVLRGTDMDGYVNTAWENIQELIKVWNKYKDAYQDDIFKSKQ